MIIVNFEANSARIKYWFLYNDLLLIIKMNKFKLVKQSNK